jgi:hypothetical protein
MRVPIGVSVTLLEVIGLNPTNSAQQNFLFGVYIEMKSNYPIMRYRDFTFQGQTSQVHAYYFVLWRYMLALAAFDLGNFSLSDETWYCARLHQLFPSSALLCGDRSIIPGSFVGCTLLPGWNGSLSISGA